MTPKACEICGGTFTTDRPTRATCGPACRKVRAARLDRVKYLRTAEDRKAARRAAWAALPPAERERLCAERRARLAAAREADRPVREARRAEAAAERKRKNAERMKRKWRDDPEHRTKAAAYARLPEVKEKNKAHTAAWKKANPEKYQATQLQCRSRQQLVRIATIAPTLTEKLNEQGNTGPG